VQWELRTATIGNDKGAVIFEQRDIEVPADWSQTATNIVVSKYFYGKMGSPERERSVANWCIAWSTPSPMGRRSDGYFKRRRKTARTSATNWRT
jgi:ribonucleoside-diphosphate reductase alpha chain